MDYSDPVIKNMAEEILEDDDKGSSMENLKGFAPKEFKHLKRHEKAYIARRE